MKAITALIACSAATSVTFGALAQQQQQPRRPGDAQQQRQAERPMDTRPLQQRIGQPGPMLHHVADIHGKRVENLMGENLGKIDTLIADMNEGRVTYAVVSVGGFLGIGDTLVAVPWEAFQLRPMFDGLVLDMTRSELEAAQTFTRERWPNFTDQQWQQQTHRYYGTSPGMRPGTQPPGGYIRPDRDRDFDRERDQQWDRDRQPDLQRQTQQIEQQLQQSFTRLGVSQQEAQQHARQLSQRIAQERPQQQQLRQMIEEAFTRAGVDQQQAQQEAQRVAPQIQQHVSREGQPGQQPGQRPGQQPGQQQQMQQVQQQLQQSLTRLGVDQQRAQQHAQQLAQRILQEQPDQRELQQMLQQEFTRAGVAQQQAQQEAQRVSQQIHPMIQRDRDRDRDRDFDRDRVRDRDRQPERGMTAMAISTDDLIGTKVENRAGENLGNLDNFAMDIETGEFEFAIVGVGGFLGLWQSHVAVPWEALEITETGERDYRVVLDATREQLDRAPEYDMDKWPTYNDVKWARGVFPGVEIREPMHRPGQQPGARPGQPGQQPRDR